MKQEALRLKENLEANKTKLEVIEPTDEKEKVNN